MKKETKQNEGGGRLLVDWNKNTNLMANHHGGGDAGKKKKLL